MTAWIYSFAGLLILQMTATHLTHAVFAALWLARPQLMRVRMTTGRTTKVIKRDNTDLLYCMQYHTPQIILYFLSYLWLELSFFGLGNFLFIFVLFFVGWGTSGVFAYHVVQCKLVSPCWLTCWFACLSAKEAGFHPEGRNTGNAEKLAQFILDTGKRLSQMYTWVAKELAFSKRVLSYK